MRRHRIAAILASAAVMLAGVFISARAGDAPIVPQASTRPSEAEWSRASADMALAATNLWNALSPDQQSTIRYDFASEERHNFHFVPRERKGMPWAQMNPTQRLLAHALLATGLSQRTFVETTTIMSLEEILAAIEKGKGPQRDPELYYFTVFGNPGGVEPWAWRVEGHHISLNFTVAGGKGVASTPAFLGVNPAEVREGPRRGLRALKAEEYLGFQLVGSLTDDQKKKAVLSADAPREIVTGNKRKAEPGEPQGIAFVDLKVEQQAMLRVLVDVYAHRVRDEIAHEHLGKIETAGWEKVYFAWAGGIEPGKGHYYRIHGPTFIVEFDNTQNGANHIHTVWRDLSNDFGEDLLKAHYDHEHKAN
jgi:hypothetical protein